ncbi:MAG: DUF1127 domain-containing protein [Rhodobacteraceae bacterium]|nr:DUF1127 domain-containing protein [Paracoccaceae bacterium]
MGTLNQISHRQSNKDHPSSFMLKTLSGLAAALGQIKGSFKRRMTEHELDKLNDHQLRDIGVSRDDLNHFIPPGSSRRELNKLELLLLLHRG